jgi:hypothetical protein
MTRRERLERKLEKRREWAASRERKANAAISSAISMVSCIPMGQPILIGHHSEKGHRALLARSDNAMRRGVESADMAKHHESKAEGLEAQLDSSIYSDDPDAVEALEAKVAALEAERDRIKAFNASCRKGIPNEALLDDDQRADIAVCRRVWNMGPAAQFPAYKLSNLGATIRQAKQRIEQVKRRQQRTEAAEASTGGVSIVGGDYVNVTFAEKPGRAVLDELKAAGFRWSQGCWTGKRANLPASVTELTEAA